MHAITSKALCLHQDCVIFDSIMSNMSVSFILSLYYAKIKKKKKKNKQTKNHERVGILHIHSLADVAVESFQFDKFT